MKWITCNELPEMDTGKTYSAKQVWPDGDYNYFEIEIDEYDLKWTFTDDDILMGVVDSSYIKYFWLDESIE